MWLDPARTSPFAFYQFWLNTDDRDVVRYLKSFTFLAHDTIAELATVTERAPETREAQRVLAQEITTLVHGAEQVARAQHASRVLFGEDIAQLPAEDVLAIFADVPAVEVSSALLAGEGVPIVDLAVLARLAPSKGEARRLVQGGGIYVNNRKISDTQARISVDMAIGGRVLVVRKGAKSNSLVQITDTGG